MTQPWRIGVVFGLCLLIGAGAVAWISVATLRLDRAEAQARRQAALEENVRLALWRMDSNLAPLVAQENVRPYFQYSAFYPAERAYTRMFAELQPNEVLVPSPLLTFESPQVLLHFQVSPEGEFTSPQVPLGNNRDLAETGYRKTEQIEAATRRLAELRNLAPAAALCAALPREINVAQGQSPNVSPNRLVRSFGSRNQPRNQPASQRRLSENEQESRQQAFSNAQGWNPDLSLQTVLAVPVREATLQPLWMGDTLLLARRVVADGKSYIQGCWLDWPVIRQGLLESIRDLLPGAALETVRGPPDPGDTRCLAALPVRLVPGALPVEMAAEPSPLRASLYVAWASVLLAVLIVGWVLWQAVALSERRGAFVSAVTHELRTPLTTFRLYTDLLSNPGALDEAKRGRYLETLRREADRLGHLVENVLAYARLERKGRHGRAETRRLAEFVAPARERLADRASQAGMRLEVTLSDEAAALPVRADPGAVEQILYNLVDNACKYAAAAKEPVIHIAAARDGRSACLRIRDHGPGIPHAESGKLFRPFSKSAKEAAQSAPGVGLGLALSRRLARQMGGDLTLDEAAKDGACFELRLPLAES